MSESQHEALTDIAEVRRNETEKQDDRFWHMKAYWIQRGESIYTAVGSCNFTEAGLAGEGGNVEAMLVFEKIEPEWPEESDTVRLEDLSEQPADEEEVPEPVPLVIVVAYDWQSESWRWFLDAGASQDDFQLSLPGLTAFRIVQGSGE